MFAGVVIERPMIDQVVGIVKRDIAVILDKVGDGEIGKEQEYGT